MYHATYVMPKTSKLHPGQNTSVTYKCVPNYKLSNSMFCHYNQFKVQLTTNNKLATSPPDVFMWIGSYCVFIYLLSFFLAPKIQHQQFLHKRMLSNFDQICDIIFNWESTVQFEGQKVKSLNLWKLCKIIPILCSLCCNQTENSLHY